MKLHCSVSVINRILPTLSIKSEKRCRNATLAVMKPPKDPSAYIVLVTPSNKSGVRYKVQGNIEKTFGQFKSEGKMTIRFREPPHDVCITADQSALKNFMTVVKKVWSGEELDIPEIKNEKSIPQIKTVTTKMDITQKANYPVLQSFPSTLVNLNIVDCQLKKFDLRITKLRNLTSLSLCKNSITELPPELGTLALKSLSLANNKLVNKYESWLFLSGPISKTLEYLDLSNNEMRSLPNGLSRLFGLKIIKLRGNSLTTIPFRICLLPRLQQVDLSHNQLESLSGSIVRRHLYKLDTLDVSGNEGLKESLNERPPKIPVCTVHTLLEYSARVVSKLRLRYDEKTVPRTLVADLDRVKMCYCGRYCLQDYGTTFSLAEAKVLANTFISTNLITMISLHFKACCPEHFYQGS